MGGFVITRGPLCELVPIANAAMENRTVVEWDKDDLDALGILKIDVLGLGMLSCIRKAFELLARHHDRAEVAIVRPGPIQGDMVHPYLRRRRGEEPVVYPSEDLRGVLGKTLGVPLFQEQAMRIAIVAGGFTPAEADSLRRAMATFRHTGTIHTFRDKLVEGMAARGYERDFAERCFHQIEGFGEYGFPESHAASFALLVYVSAWLKRHYPAAFACGLLNSQPMGFYAPAQIVRDARDHGVAVRPVDVNCSDWDCTLEPDSGGSVALRLGLRQVKGLAEAEKLVAARGKGYDEVHDLWRRAGLAPTVLERLAGSDAFGSIGLSRRQGLWAVQGLGPEPLPLFAAAPAADGASPRETVHEPAVHLAPMPLGQEVIEDYRAIRLSLKKHPLALLRPALSAERYMPSGRLEETPAGSRVRVAGLVVCRQRPGTASGVIFMTLEDETGIANVIVWPRVFERFRRVVLRARLIGILGKVEREGIVIHVVSDRLVDLSHRLAELVHTDRPHGDGPTASLDPPPARGSHPVGPPTINPANFPSRDFH